MCHYCPLTRLSVHQPCIWGPQFVDGLCMLGEWLDLMVIKVFSNLVDSVILCQRFLLSSSMAWFWRWVFCSTVHTAGCCSTFACEQALSWGDTGLVSVWGGEWGPFPEVAITVSNQSNLEVDFKDEWLQGNSLCLSLRPVASCYCVKCRKGGNSSGELKSCAVLRLQLHFCVV